MKLTAGLLFCFAAPAADVTLTAAALRLMPERWNKEANFLKLAKFAAQAKSLGADLAVAPEGFLEGYVGNTHANPQTTRERYLAAGETLDGVLLNRVRGLARELKIHLGTGFAERRGERMFNSFVVFSPEGDVALHYSKSHNNDDEPFNTTGVEFPVAKTALGRLGALICYDRQLPETARVLAIGGAQLILVPAWGMNNDMNDAMMRTRAFENSVYLMFVHPQRALIVDPRGAIVAQDRPGPEDQVVAARITLDGRIGKGAIRSRKPDLYRDLMR
jgi:predicted amidohydrolase